MDNYILIIENNLEGFIFFIVGFLICLILFFHILKKTSKKKKFKVENYSIELSDTYFIINAQKIEYLEVKEILFDGKFIHLKIYDRKSYKICFNKIFDSFNFYSIVKKKCHNLYN
jgi:hypothetical protein